MFFWSLNKCKLCELFYLEVWDSCPSTFCVHFWQALANVITVYAMSKDIANRCLRRADPMQNLLYTLCHCRYSLLMKRAGVLATLESRWCKNNIWAFLPALHYWPPYWTSTVKHMHFYLAYYRAGSKIHVPLRKKNACNHSCCTLQRPVQEHSLHQRGQREANQQPEP